MNSVQNLDARVDVFRVGNQQRLLVGLRRRVERFSVRRGPESVRMVQRQEDELGRDPRHALGFVVVAWRRPRQLLGGQNGGPLGAEVTGHGVRSVPHAGHQIRLDIRRNGAGSPVPRPLGILCQRTRRLGLQASPPLFGVLVGLGDGGNGLSPAVDLGRRQPVLVVGLGTGKRSVLENCKAVGLY